MFKVGTQTITYCYHEQFTCLIPTWLHAIPLGINKIAPLETDPQNYTEQRSLKRPTIIVHFGVLLTLFTHVPLPRNYTQAQTMVYLMTC